MKRLKLLGFIALAAITVVWLVGSKLELESSVLAETVNTSANVGNSPPAFTAGPAESTASTATSPTNEGSGVTFQATANEPNSENYYLAVCKTNSITPVNGNAPTCGGGAWCVSTSTADDAQATCTHTTVDGDAQVNAWYAFVCDANATASECSTASQGTGDSGSPFNVNHDPSFTVIVDDGGTGSNSGADPGGTMTFTATASDPDDDTAQDTVKLVVCGDNTGATAAGCSGTEICVSSLAASNPTCNISIANVAPDTTVNYYAYVFDSHNFASGSNARTGDYLINNVAPGVSAVTLNGGLDITLTEGTTTNVTVTATVTDNNSCQDITTVETSVYRSAITYTGCDANAEDNNNNCYAQVSCSLGGANTCDSASDASASYTCTVALQFHAESTDDYPLTGTIQYEAQNWLSTVNAIDDDSATGNDEVETGVEVDSLLAMDITASINYGALDVGESNDPLDKITTVTATGNVGLDQELSGTNLTDGSTGVIPVANQKYALAGSTSYASGTALSGTPTEVELNCQKTSVTGSPATKDTYWGILIPASVPPGPYTGQNTVTAVLGETAGW